MAITTWRFPAPRGAEILRVTIANSMTPGVSSPSAYKHDSKNVVYHTVFVIQEVSQDHIRKLKALSSILLVLCKRQNPI